MRRERSVDNGASSSLHKWVMRVDPFLIPHSSFHPSQVLLNSGKKTVVHRLASADSSLGTPKAPNSGRRIHISVPKKRTLAYDGSQLVRILDSFLLSEARTLLSASNVLRHWHDLSGCPDKLRSELISKDRLCSPPLSFGNIFAPNVSAISLTLRSSHCNRSRQISPPSDPKTVGLDGA
jgi:hypothetical protein